MAIEFLIFLTVFTPALVGGLNLFFDKNPNVRDSVTLLGALLTFYFSTNIFLEFDGQATQYSLITIMPGIDISFHIEPLGIIFSMLASGLWILTHIYAIGYMRGAKEKNQSRFFQSQSRVLWGSPSLVIFLPYFFSMNFLPDYISTSFP